jgi:predicted permease
LLGSVSGIAGRTLGVVPAVIFAISRTLEAYGANPRVFLEDFVKQLAISFCPLVLVMLGAILSRSGAPKEGLAWSKKDCERVDPPTSRSTLK